MGNYKYLKKLKESDIDIVYYSITISMNFLVIIT